MGVALVQHLSQALGWRQEWSPGQPPSAECSLHHASRACWGWLCSPGDSFSLSHWDLNVLSGTTMPSNVGIKLVLFLLDGKPNKQAQNSKKSGVNKKGLITVIVLRLSREECPGKADRPGRSPASLLLSMRQFSRVAILCTLLINAYTYGHFPRSGISALAPGDAVGHCFHLLFDVATLGHFGCTKSYSPPPLFSLDCCIRKL